MKIDFKKFIQIAGIIDQAETDMLLERGVEFLGFPLRLLVNKEDLSESDAAKIIKNLDNPSNAVLITYLSNSDEIIKLCDYLGTTSVQLHGSISLKELENLKTQRPDFTVIKSLVVTNNNFKELQQTVENMYRLVDAFITDTFDPTTGASGATGKTHDWNISRKLVEISPKPLILAGGLNPGNVYDAILQVNPAGVDTHTGVEGSDGRKDISQVRAFLKNAKRAFDEILN